MSTLARAPSIAALLAIFTAMAIGCSAAPVQAEGDGGFVATPYVTQPGDAGAVQMAVRTSPQPPTRGTISAELTITNAADGGALDGLVLAVTPWMPAMDHGTSITPVVTAEGQGKYLVTSLDLYMSGTWALQTTVQDATGASIDYAAPTLDIP